MGADVLVFHDIIRGDPESRKLEGGRQEVGVNKICRLIVGIVQHNYRMCHQRPFPVSMGFIGLKA